MHLSLVPGDLALVDPPGPCRITWIERAFRCRPHCLHLDERTPPVARVGEGPRPAYSGQQFHSGRHAGLVEEFVGDAQRFAGTAVLDAVHGQQVEREPLHRPITGVPRQHVRFQERAAGGGVLVGDSEKPPGDLGHFGDQSQVLTPGTVGHGAGVQLPLGSAPDLYGGGGYGVGAVAVVVVEEVGDGGAQVRDLAVNAVLSLPRNRHDKCGQGTVGPDELVQSLRQLW